MITPPAPAEFAQAKLQAQKELDKIGKRVEVTQKKLNQIKQSAR